MFDLEQLVRMPDPDLGQVDPVLMNLVVAKGIPSLAHLDILDYQARADEWVADIVRELPRLEQHFWQAPKDWRGDINFFRLGAVCWYVDEKLGVSYREDQRDVAAIRYTDPSDLFLNGVMDTRRGTCGNMAALHVALAWRLGWPVSLARAGMHLLARYEDGTVAYNIEATNTGNGGFSSRPDEFYIKQYSFSKAGQFVGVDLRALRPREVLGVFVGARARHYRDTGRIDEALREYTLAHRLYPMHPVFEEAAVEAANRGIATPSVKGCGDVPLTHDVIDSISDETWAWLGREGRVGG